MKARIAVALASVAALSIAMVSGASDAASVGRAESLQAQVMAAPAPAAATSRAHRHWSPCIAEINAYRAAAGRQPVTYDPIVSAVATAHSAYQATLGSMQHQGPGGNNAGQRLTAAGYRWSTWAENVAAGQQDCAAVMRAFMGSSGHRANLLGSAFVRVGAAASVSQSGVRYWTIVLTAPG